MDQSKSQKGFRKLCIKEDCFPWKLIIVLYDFLCILVTIFIIGWWLYQYSLENLACSIDIKSFLEHDHEVQPMFSVCITDPKLDDKIKNLTKNKFNKSSYIKFLRGDEFQEELKNIDYNEIKFNWTNYFSSPPDASLLSKTGKSLGRVPKSKYWTYYTTYIGLQSYNRYLTNCIGVQPLRKEVSTIRLYLNMSIFEQGIRPSTTQEFRVFLHYPHQIIRSYSSKKSLWDPIGNESSYNMMFIIKDVQVLQRHPTRDYDCIEDWKNYDELLFKKVLSDLKCQSPYQEFSGMNYSVCSSKKTMKETLLYPSNRLIRAYNPPCRSLEQSQYEYSEQVENKLKKKMIRMTFTFTSQFQEIIQYRKINEGVSSFQLLCKCKGINRLSKLS